MSPVVGGSSGEDAVVIIGKTLGLHQGLAAAIGAGDEGAMLRIFSAEGFDGGLGDAGHFVDAAVAEVGNFFGMAEGPAGIGATCGVSGVSANRRVAFFHGNGQRLIINFTGEATVAPALEISVPRDVVSSADGKPHFNFDRGIGAGLGFGNDATEGGEGFVEIGIAEHPRGHRRRGSEGAGGDGLRREDFRAGKLELGKGFAGMGSGLGVCSKRQQKSNDRSENYLCHEDVLRARQSAQPKTQVPKPNQGHPTSRRLSAKHYSESGKNWEGVQWQKAPASPRGAGQAEGGRYNRRRRARPRAVRGKHALPSREKVKPELVSEERWVSLRRCLPAGWRDFFGCSRGGAVQFLAIPR